MLNLITLFALISLLCACGGGNSSAGNTTQSSAPSSNSSTSLSTSPVSSLVSSSSSSSTSSTAAEPNPSTVSSSSSAISLSSISSLSSSSSSTSSASSTISSKSASSVPSSSVSSTSSKSVSSTSSSASSKTISSSSSSASSISSSSSSASPCQNPSGTVFSECFDKQYGYLFAAQYQPTYIESLTSSAGDQVQWSILDIGSTHSNVIDVRFTDNSRKGQLIIGYPDSQPSTIDFSQYQTGSLKFDLRAVSFGDAYNNTANGAVFSIRMDCLWPCASHETKIVLPTIGSWTSVDLPISDLIATGLDISKVSASLVLIPQGSQRNLHIQLDNIQLVAGDPVSPSPAPLFKEDFNSKTIPEWKVTKIIGTSSATPTTIFGFGATLFFSWSQTNDMLRFETTLNQPIDVTNKKGSFQIICWEDSDTRFSYKLVTTDINGNTYTSGPYYYFNPETWYNAHMNFGGAFTGGFDSTKVNKVGLQFEFYGTYFGTSTCQVDTIRITE